MTNQFTFFPHVRETGAPAQPPRRAPAGTRHAAALAVAAVLWAAALTGCADATPPRAQDAARGTPPAGAAFTGEYADGLPVYRLPRVEVVASRKAELAKAAADERARASGGIATGTTVAGRVYRAEADEAPRRPL